MDGESPTPEVPGAVDEVISHPKPESKPQPSRANSAKSFSEKEKEKIQSIRAACQARDRAAVAKLALSRDGLISDEVRQEAWPFLLGYSDKIENSSEREPWEKLPPHGDESQVQLDVDRSFIYYPTNVSKQELDECKHELSELIVEVLRRHPMLCYFQGFHDICQVILLVLGAKQAVPAVEHIAFLRIRDFMLPTMQPAMDQLRLLYPLLHDIDPKLCTHLSRTQPFFALAATLTLYAHDIQEYSNIARLFDVFLAMDPVFPLYLFTEIVLQRRDELFDIPDDEPEMLHSILSKLPKPLDLEDLIDSTIMLLQKHPPESLSTWRNISRMSVLKTAKQPALSGGISLKNSANLREAEEVFQKHCREMARAKQRKELFQAVIRHKRSTAIGVSVLVGVSSVAFGLYARRQGTGEFSGIFNIYYHLWRILGSLRQ